MSNVFVWFHNGSDKPADSARFYEKLLGWKPAAGPPGTTMLAKDAAPFAGIGATEGTRAAWIPFVEVDDVEAAAKRAIGLGAEIIKERTRGPAGEYAILKDPGGAPVALWQKAA
jgi:predicted enzyme related to lactoylglutathione lyase